MDDEARLQLIAQASLQHARDEIQRARANVPIGFALIGVGLALSMIGVFLPLGLVGKVLVAGIGFPFIPGGVAVLVKSGATIGRCKRKLRELELPTARVV